MWCIPSVAHFSKFTVSFLTVPHFSRCGSFASVPKFSKGGAFLQVCRIFFKCAALFQVHFSTSGAHFQVWRISPSACSFLSVPRAVFQVCSSFFRLCRIFANVTHFSKCAAVYQARRVFVTMALFCKSATFLTSAALLQVCCTFPIVAHFCKCSAFF